MSERQKVRLVRCPRCENLLREPSDFSVYRCGNCGTFLQAKKKLAINEGPSKKLENEKNEERPQKLKISSQRENGDYVEIKRETKGPFPNIRKDRVSAQKNHHLLGYNNEYRLPLKQPIPESAESSIISNGVTDPYRMANNRTKFSGSRYASDDATGKRLAHLEQDRVELLRKLDELTEQISRNGSVKPVERRPEFEQYSKEMEMKKSYSYENYIGPSQSQFVSYSRNSLYHRPTCTCIDCWNPNPIPNFPALPLRNAKSGSKWPSKFNDSGAQASRNVRLCHPMAGGSPYIACPNCLQVLKLPRKPIPMGIKRCKIQCGACSTELSLETNGKRLRIFISKEVPLSLESVFRIKETEQLVNYDNAGNGNESSYQENTRKSFSSESVLEYIKPEVSVNGHPIPYDIVKKVEKLAGPIQSGDYWYDFEAGFWGVMGHPCLGIIPPFIKEFNYPMARNCGAGNTNVFVNGRELNKKDLDLLASRGLPTTKDKSYIVEISGRVFDDDTGIKICNLGRLAPTVEKLKRGFGMKVPRSCEK